MVKYLFIGYTPIRCISALIADDIVFKLILLYLLTVFIELFKYSLPLIILESADCFDLFIRIELFCRTLFEVIYDAEDGLLVQVELSEKRGDPDR